MVQERIQQGGHQFVVGDCWGGDELFQQLLHRAGVEDVEIHHAAETPRVQVNPAWANRRTESPARPNTREWHTAKDRTMTLAADEGIAAVQDVQRISQGTRANLDRLMRQGKPAVAIGMNGETWEFQPE